MGFSLFAMCDYDWEKRCLWANSHPMAGPRYLVFARRLKQSGLDIGIVRNQSYAPSPPACPEVRSYLKRALECTAEADGRICVIHPDNEKSAEETAEIYEKFLPFARDCGVKIATENRGNWDCGKEESSFAACATSEVFVKCIDIVHDEDLVGCLDIGHAEIRGSGSYAVAMIRALSPRLQALAPSR